MRARPVQELDRLDMVAHDEVDDLDETRRGVEFIAIGDGAGDGEPREVGSAVATVAPEGLRAVDVVEEIGAVVQDSEAPQQEHNSQAHDEEHAEEAPTEQRQPRPRRNKLTLAI